MKKLLLALLTISFLITSCVDKTPLSPEDKIYAGKWISNDGTWIQIYNDGGGSFERSNSSVTGGATVISDSTIKIGLMGIGIDFFIDQAPNVKDGEWTMELDGNLYVKQ